MYIVILAATIIVILLYGRLQGKRKSAGLQGWVKSQDLDGKSGRIYRNYKKGISAKPDVVESNKVIEYKSASVGDKARRTDVLQVTAQMIAAGKNKAEIRYGNDKRFEFTKETPIIKSSMKRIDWISRQMVWHLQKRLAPSGTPRPSKCAKCFYRDECPDAKKVA
jgi:CRISPR/Cas system-associated exonuclease Cas4 (RecB family)